MLWSLALVALAGCEAAPGPALPAARAPDVTFNGRVVLGSPSLTAGIPGNNPKGPATRREIEAWLADPRNHEPLDFALPLSLRHGAPEIRLAESETLTRAKIELGRQLYFDFRLAGSPKFACGTCHHPESGFSRWMVMPVINRNVAAGFNRILSTEQFWDGRAKSLEEQVEHPLTTDYEMMNTIHGAVFQIAKVEGYQLQFEKIYGVVSYEGITRSLAAFQRAVVTGPSPYDYEETIRRYEGRSPGDFTEPERAELEEARRGAAEHPMSDAARRGRDLFFSERARCATCHSGPNFTDEQYHAVGVAPLSTAKADEGRFKVTGHEEDRRAFKTPTLRNVEQTPPYMHAGQLETLEEVVAWFNRPKGEHVSPLLRPLDLTSGEQRDLVEFLKSLTGKLPPVETGRLPE